MNTFEIKYLGNLRTAATHLDSGSVINTDAPKDNHGLGAGFSPTDIDHYGYCSREKWNQY